MARASGLTLGGRAQLAGYTVPWPSLVSLALPKLFVPPASVCRRLADAGHRIGAIVLAGVGVMDARPAGAGRALVCLWRSCCCSATRRLR